MIFLARGSISASNCLKLPPPASQATSLRSGWPLGILGTGPVGGPLRLAWEIVSPSCVQAACASSVKLRTASADTMIDFLTDVSSGGIRRQQLPDSLALEQYRRPVSLDDRVVLGTALLQRLELACTRIHHRRAGSGLIARDLDHVANLQRVPAPSIPFQHVARCQLHRPRGH